MKKWIWSGECLLDHSGALLILVIGKWNKSDHFGDRFDHYIIFPLTTSSCFEVIDSLIVFLIIKFCLDSWKTFWWSYGRLTWAHSAVLHNTKMWFWNLIKMLQLFTTRYDSLRSCGEVDDELKRMTWYQAGIPRSVFIHSSLYSIILCSLNINEKNPAFIAQLSVDIFCNCVSRLHESIIGM